MSIAVSEMQVRLMESVCIVLDPSLSNNSRISNGIFSYILVSFQSSVSNSIAYLLPATCSIKEQAHLPESPAYTKQRSTPESDFERQEYLIHPSRCAVAPINVLIAMRSAALRRICSLTSSRSIPLPIDWQQPAVGRELY